MAVSAYNPMSDTPKRPRKVKTPKAPEPVLNDIRLQMLSGLADDSLVQFRETSARLGRGIHAVLMSLPVNTLYYAVGNIEENSMLVTFGEAELYATWFCIVDRQGFNDPHRSIAYGGVPDWSVHHPTTAIPPPPANMREMYNTCFGYEQFASGLPVHNLDVLHLLGFAGQNKWLSTTLSSEGA